MALKKGDKVVTSGGVHGTIKVLRDKYVELEIAPKVVIKVEKSAIQHFEGKPHCRRSSKPTSDSGKQEIQEG